MFVVELQGIYHRQDGDLHRQSRHDRFLWRYQWKCLCPQIGGWLCTLESTPRYAPRITGSPLLVSERLYVPISSGEEGPAIVSGMVYVNTGETNAMAGNVLLEFLCRTMNLQFQLSFR
jgi:hypothetical protein